MKSSVLVVAAIFILRLVNSNDFLWKFIMRVNERKRRVSEVLSEIYVSILSDKHSAISMLTGTQY